MKYAVATLVAVLAAAPFVLLSGPRMAPVGLVVGLLAAWFYLRSRGSGASTPTKRASASTYGVAAAITLVPVVGMVALMGPRMVVLALPLSALATYVYLYDKVGSRARRA